MEEKERFEYYLAQNQLYDKTNDELYCFGIEQDKTRLVDFLNLMNEDWWALYIRNKELREENQQLKQQLADKEKELTYMTKQAKKFNNEAQKYYEDAYCNDFHNQDKISFCIEKLEKVKEDVKNVHIEDTQYDCYCFQETTRDECAKIIDNQIEELKKEMK